MIFPVAAALASAATFAVGSALQHQAAGRASLGQLIRRPAWVLGLLLSAVAFSLHGLALSRGELGLVQPVIVSGIVFAVLFRAALDRRRPSLAIIGWLILTWAGLALVVVIRGSRSSSSTGVAHELAFVVVGISAAAVLAIAAGRNSTPRHRGLLFGLAAGILFGLVAGLLKLVTVALRSGLGQAVSHWSPWLLIVIGGAAVLLNQLAYQSAPLSTTAPVLNIAQVLVAIAFGVIVFGERFDGSALLFLGELVGLVMVGLGIWQLAAHQPLDRAKQPAATA